MRFVRILLLLFLCLVFIWFTLKKAVIIKEVSCSNQFGSCSNIILEKIKSAEGKNVLDGKKIIKQDLEKEIIVANFTSRFRLPNKIVVYLVEKKPIIAIGDTVLHDQKFTLIDKEGLVLDKGEKGNLPILMSNKAFQIGEKIDDKTLFAAFLLQKLNQMYEVKMATVDNNQLESTLDGSVSVIFPLEGDQDFLIGSFNAIFSRLITQQQRSKIEVDMRFKNPVIR
ncbi:hypothetical protein A3D00_00285 [Candidatus Woesebacteria bacterium RIFCSPHIGHO2_02_FULL_38_9]|uniref:POTRA domain-containing protein n=1 Tax=Candidatus Woesebacteria bacterium RIFCSPHIGHO2_01_FULL_39_28 TaxID=1802496 RepID=A0A1F7YCA8_9BACT|nr:MAG: hypothetical protein A2627_03065 [Candidatus Woesebacteria bacterium RIFCSPHIGHO2_01_FULL_39_28]OGM35296.1 MAG: hypothetical protein A3D00_00285 [Candidatus Woesebacteria bacterium RIFCSPHIGHO2_02_FULL_38_9]OGM58027.1 MAG: hypothetical protein A3A50_02075 [Candidatus Woesebacteria bacterium RIFCSPLOWO2_01_FULL_38_20]